MNVEDADGPTLLDHEEAADAEIIDAPGVHEIERLGGERLRANGVRPARHHLAHLLVEKVGAHVAAQVAVGDDTDEPAGLVHHADAAEVLRSHQQDGLGHAHLGPGQRHLLAPVHDVGHAQQTAADHAAGVEHLELVGREAAALEQRDRERVSQRQHRRGRGGGRQAERAGLGRARQQERHIRRLGERALGARGYDDQWNRDAPRIGDEVGELIGFARVRERQHRVLARDHPEIAVARLGRMDEERRRAGGGERRRDLARDVAALAHAGDDDPAAHLLEPIDGRHEDAVERPAEGVDCRRLEAQHAHGCRKVGLASLDLARLRRRPRFAKLPRADGSGLRGPPGAHPALPHIFVNLHRFPTLPVWPPNG